MTEWQLKNSDLKRYPHFDQVLKPDEIVAHRGTLPLLGVHAAGDPLATAIEAVPSGVHPQCLARHRRVGAQDRRPRDGA